MKNKFLKIFYLIIVFVMLFGVSQVHATIVDLPEKPSYWNKGSWDTQTSKEKADLKIYLTKNFSTSALVQSTQANDWSKWAENENDFITSTEECILYVNKYVEENGYEAINSIGDFEETYIKIVDNYIKKRFPEFMKGDVANKYESEIQNPYYMDIMKNATKFIKETRKTAQCFKIGVAKAKAEGKDVKASNWQFAVSDGKEKPVSFADSDDVKSRYSEAQIKEYIKQYGDEGIKLLSSGVVNSWNWHLSEKGPIEKLSNQYTEEYIKAQTGLAVKELEEKQELVGKNGHTYEMPNNTGYKNGDKDVTDLDTIITSGTSFIDSAKENKIEAETIKKLSNTIYNILLVAGIIIAIIIGAVIGIMFITGSVEQKADVKKLLIPYIVGCVIVFGSFAIWKIAVTMFSSM